MKRMLRTFYLLLACILLGWGFLFALFNDTPLALHLVWLELPPQRVSWWLLASFSLGLLFGAVLTGLARMGGRLRRRDRNDATKEGV